MLNNFDRFQRGRGCWGMRLKLALHSRALLVAACVVALVLVCASVLWVCAPWQARAFEALVSPKAALSDYSWSELSALSSKLAAFDDEAAALDEAARYGLCDQDGNLLSQDAKPLRLADGSQALVKLVGIRHDERTDGGVAGLSFMLETKAAHAMNHAFEDPEGANADSSGGWRASDMRAWLNGTFVYELPTELRSCLVKVQKTTANNPGTADELDLEGGLAGAASDWAEQTSDMLWLFSTVELCGSVPVHAAMGIDETMVPLYASEGQQYQLFSQLDVSAFEPCEEICLQGATWWLRTKTLEFGDGFWLVGTDGTPLNGLGEDAHVVHDSAYAPEKLWGPDHARRVVVGFCL